jgi:hypothetical protein
VPSELKQAVEAWKRADAQAKEAEARLRTAWDDFDAGIGGSPSRALMSEVLSLRGIAYAKLTEAMVLTRGDIEPPT